MPRPIVQHKTYRQFDELVVGLEHMKNEVSALMQAWIDYRITFRNVTLANVEEKTEQRARMIEKMARYTEDFNTAWKDLKVKVRALKQSRRL